MYRGALSYYQDSIDEPNALEWIHRLQTTDGKTRCRADATNSCDTSVCCGWMLPILQAAVVVPDHRRDHASRRRHHRNNNNTIGNEFCAERRG